MQQLIPQQVARAAPPAALTHLLRAINVPQRDMQKTKEELYGEWTADLVQLHQKYVTILGRYARDHNLVLYPSQRPLPPPPPSPPIIPPLFSAHPVFQADTEGLSASKLARLR